MSIRTVYLLRDYGTGLYVNIHAISIDWVEFQYASLFTSLESAENMKYHYDLEIQRIEKEVKKSISPDWIDLMGQKLELMRQIRERLRIVPIDLVEPC